MRSKLLRHDLRQPALRLITLKIAAKGGINLSQGTCQLETPDVVREGAVAAIRAGEGNNRYSPADGIPQLREALVARLRSFNAIPCRTENVAVTAGATGALEAICRAFLEPGDEVILFSPGYPYHRNVLERRGAIIRAVQLQAPDWSFAIDDFARAVTPKTKFVLICNPGNPTGKVFTRDELTAIGDICHDRGVFCVTDEVYEYITFDGRRHTSMASLPGMFERTITIGSFSKTFAITGWRVGYLCAPEDVYPALRAESDQLYICPPSPLQYGVLRGLEALGPEFYAEQLRAYTRKRQILCEALETAGLAPHRPQGAYYVLADTSARFPGLTSEEVALDVLVGRAATGAAIGAVPASDFLGPQVLGDPARSNFLRFCFAMPDDDLVRAAGLLKAITA
jgi:aminotransferase